MISSGPWPCRAWPSIRASTRRRKIDKYQTARFDQVRYSVPKCYAFQTATMKAYVARIDIVVAGQVIARHQRSCEPGSQVLDPLHYLASLRASPGRSGSCRRVSPVEVAGHFPGQARTSGSSAWASDRPASLCSHPGITAVSSGAAQLRQALEQSQGFDGFDAEVIAQRTRHLALREQLASTPAAAVGAHADQALRVQVPAPMLNHFTASASR